MKEKTLRYPGHAEKMRMMRDTGFFEKTPIRVGTSSIRPVDFTAALLFPAWEREDDEGDITVMRVLVEGLVGGRRERHVYDLVDRRDPETAVHSMARTTGYPATMAARMLASGLYDRRGICPPEFIGQCDEAFEFMLGGLADRGITLDRSIGSC
jgi:saccharopine dehydrogenase-like NADP-dependent oxidoreductase